MRRQDIIAWMKNFNFYLQSLRQVVEHGMTNRLGTVWKPKKPQCPESHSSIPTAVSLTEFSPALVMIGAAFSVSIFIMLVENLVRKFLYKRNSIPFFTPFNRKISSPVALCESEEVNDSKEMWQDFSIIHCVTDWKGIVSFLLSITLFSIINV